MEAGLITPDNIELEIKMPQFKIKKKKKRKAFVNLSGDL